MAQELIESEGYIKGVDFDGVLVLYNPSQNGPFAGYGGWGSVHGEHGFVENMNDSTYHTNTMWKLKFTQLDPSVALAFVCKYEEDFLDLIDSLKTVIFTLSKISFKLEIF